MQALDDSFRPAIFKPAIPRSDTTGPCHPLQCLRARKYLCAIQELCSIQFQARRIAQGRENIMGQEQTATTAAAAPGTQQNTRSRSTEKAPRLSAERRPEQQNTRARLIENAARLFAQRGYDKTSVADIAKAADAFPNQITHHFGGKEALFVEAARYAMLRTAKRDEDRSRDTETPESHARSLISYLLGPGSGPVMMFAEAMLLARRTPRLQDIVSLTSAEL